MDTMHSPSQLESMQARLCRIEQTLDRVISKTQQLTEQAEALIAVATESVDRHAQDALGLHERVEALGALVEQGTRPDTTQALTQLVAQIPALPALLACLVDSLDEIAAQLPAGASAQNLSENLSSLAHWLSLDSTNNLLSTLTSEDFNTAALTPLVKAFQKTSQSPSNESGLLSNLAKLRDPDTKHGLDFSLRLLQSLGHNLAHPSSDSPA